ncbi:MAG TPA: efflux RND transporter periplasmic adaptor subunit [Terriglobales bacterium]|nr:efflux RND transporter periplasmic adaptor subunit [Terriglobales bacterium]
MALVAALSLAGCGSKDAAPAAGGGGRGGPMAMPVQVVEAQPGKVSDTSTFVASIQSRDSMVIMPLVGGIIRAIEVKSGDSVRAGQPLVQLDPALQQATVQNLVNSQQALESTFEFDKQQLDRAKSLYEQKIGTLQDYQSAQSTYNNAKAQIDSLTAQIQQAKTSLSYYQVTAPRAGIVGDIPVKVGDTATTGTQLTTLDSPSGLEVYVQVPLEQSSRLKTGLPLQVLDGTGNVLENTSVRFVSPQVDPLTQSILVKADVRSTPRHALRTQQFVQARITWGTHSAYLIPVLSVVRQGASDFVFTAAPRGNGFYAHEVPVELGVIQGNNYEVKSGVNPGDKLIESTTQVLVEGMPVMPMPAGRGGAGAAGRGR